MDRDNEKIRKQKKRVKKKEGKHQKRKKSEWKVIKMMRRDFKLNYLKYEFSDRIKLKISKVIQKYNLKKNIFFLFLPLFHHIFKLRISAETFSSLIKQILLNIKMNKEMDLTTDNTEHHQQKFNNHYALKKLKDAEKNVSIIKKRFKVLKVKEDQYRSKVIQNQNKIRFHEDAQKIIKKDKEVKDRYQKKKIEQLDVYREKSKKIKNSLEEKAKQVYETISKDKVESRKKVKQTQKIHEELILKEKGKEYEEKKEKRKKISQDEENKKMVISRFKESKIKETVDSISSENERLLRMAKKKEKQMEKLSEIEDQMIKKNSFSIQMSIESKNKLRQVIGDERRFTKLPQIREKASTQQIQSFFISS